MINVRIDTKGKSKLDIEGSEEVCCQECSIALLTICEALSETTGYHFNDIFEAVVANARMLKFFKDKEREQHENRT